MLARRQLLLATSAATLEVAARAAAGQTPGPRFVAQLTAPPADREIFWRTLAFRHPGATWQLHGGTVVVVVPNVRPGEMDAAIAPLLAIRFRHKPKYRHEPG
jgi:hypothetical protein